MLNEFIQILLFPFKAFHWFFFKTMGLKGCTIVVALLLTGSTLYWIIVKGLPEERKVSLYERAQKSYVSFFVSKNQFARAVQYLPKTTPLICEFAVGLDPRVNLPNAAIRGWYLFLALWFNFTFLTQWPRRMNLSPYMKKWEIFLVPFRIVTFFAGIACYLLIIGICPFINFIAVPGFALWAILLMAALFFCLVVAVMAIPASIFLSISFFMGLTTHFCRGMIEQNGKFKKFDPLDETYSGISGKRWKKIGFDAPLTQERGVGFSVDKTGDLQ